MHAYPRHNIVIKEGFFTQQSCADFAASTHGAFFWTWMKSTKRCFVKNFDAIKNKTPNPDFVSGNTHCGTKGSRVPRVWPGGPWPRPRPGGLRPRPHHGHSSYGHGHSGYGHGHRGYGYGHKRFTRFFHGGPPGYPRGPPRGPFSHSGFGYHG